MNYKKILNIREDDTPAEINEKYRELKRIYSEDRFLEGEAGNTAAKNLMDLEAAYAEYKRVRSEEERNKQSNSFAAIEELIRQSRFDEAQVALDDITGRTADWYYTQSILFYKRNWYNESRKQLLIAIEMQPDNLKYKNSLEKLDNLMNPSVDPSRIQVNQQGNPGNNNSYNANYQGNGNINNDSDFGNSLSRMCATWCAIDMCCTCMRCFC